MKIYGTRRIRSEGTTHPPVILHATETDRQKDGKPPKFNAWIIRRDMNCRQKSRRITFVVTSEGADNKYDYDSIEIRFSYTETRKLEVAMARELGTRTVRRDGFRARPLTRLQSRHHVIK